MTRKQAAALLREIRAQAGLQNWEITPDGALIRYVGDWVQGVLADRTRDPQQLRLATFVHSSLIPFPSWILSFGKCAKKGRLGSDTWSLDDDPKDMATAVLRVLRPPPNEPFDDEDVLRIIGRPLRWWPQSAHAVVRARRGDLAEAGRLVRLALDDPQLTIPETVAWLRDFLAAIASGEQRRVEALFERTAIVFRERVSAGRM